MRRYQCQRLSLHQSLEWWREQLKRDCFSASFVGGMVGKKRVVDCGQFLSFLPLGVKESTGNRLNHIRTGAILAKL